MSFNRDVRFVFAIAAAACLVAAACATRPAGNAAVPVASSGPTPSGGIEVAVTVDDLPRHRVGGSPPVIAQALLSAFAHHRIPRVTGFINAAKLEAHPEDRAVLDAWVAAGHPLGNHEWSHADLHVVSPEAFIAGIARNEPVLATLGTPPAPKYFRYPYLREGNTVEERKAVRDYLAAHDYRIAQVTIDPYDWAYGDAYDRCTQSDDSVGRSALREAFLTEAREKLRWSQAAALAVLGRPVRHILLLHLGTLDGDAIEALLTAYEAAGVRWISLDEAFADPIYAEDAAIAGGGHYLGQLARKRNVPLPPTPSPPQDLIARACP
jgi:peptidoglycan/xylan/chitin deacetylase (PgdA/CDA1 family)